MASSSLRATVLGAGVVGVIAAAAFFLYSRSVDESCTATESHVSDESTNPQQDRARKKSKTHAAPPSHEKAVADAVAVARQVGLAHTTRGVPVRCRVHFTACPDRRWRGTDPLEDDVWRRRHGQRGGMQCCSAGLQGARVGAAVLHPCLSDSVCPLHLLTADSTSMVHLHYPSVVRASPCT